MMKLGNRPHNQTTDQIRSALIKLIIEFDPKLSDIDFNSEVHFSDLNLDSLRFMSLLSLIEKHFDLDYDDYNNQSDSLAFSKDKTLQDICNTVSDIIAYQHINRTNSSPDSETNTNSEKSIHSVDIFCGKKSSFNKSFNLNYLCYHLVIRSYFKRNKKIKHSFKGIQQYHKHSVQRYVDRYLDTSNRCYQKRYSRSSTCYDQI